MISQCIHLWDSHMALSQPLVNWRRRRRRWSVERKQWSDNLHLNEKLWYHSKHTTLGADLMVFPNPFCVAIIFFFSFLAFFRFDFVLPLKLESLNRNNNILDCAWARTHKLQSHTCWINAPFKSISPSISFLFRFCAFFYSDLFHRRIICSFQLKQKKNKLYLAWNFTLKW